MTDQPLFLVLIAASLAATFAVLWFRRQRAPRKRTSDESWILVDGSNVMHWQDNTPNLAPVLAVVRQVIDQGHVPGVVFDANAGWKLEGRYLHDGDFARLLGLKTRQVKVVPKGTQADPFLLHTAREFGARIVTNDRFRDWADAHPEVHEPGFLIRGFIRDGSVTLDRIAATEVA
ncbi:MAG: NYN domain-containing protein [Tabrizicola sp.]